MNKLEQARIEYEKRRKLVNASLIRQKKRGMKTKPLLPVFEKTLGYRILLEELI